MPEQELTEYFNKFHAADPRLYENFMRTLDAYVFGVTAAVTAAPNDEILRAAGRAQQAQKFLQLVSEIPGLQPVPSSPKPRAP
jgi:hypothetical protein